MVGQAKKLSLQGLAARTVGLRVHAGGRASPWLSRDTAGTRDPGGRLGWGGWNFRLGYCSGTAVSALANCVSLGEASPTGNLSVFLRHLGPREALEGPACPIAGTALQGAQTLARV